MNLKTTIREIFEVQNKAIILNQQVGELKKTIDPVVRAAVEQYMRLLQGNMGYVRSIDKNLPDVVAEWGTKNSYDWMVLNQNEIEVKVVHYGGSDYSAFIFPIHFLTDFEEFKWLREKIFEFNVQQAALQAATDRIADEKFRQNRYQQYLKLKAEFEPQIESIGEK